MAASFPQTLTDGGSFIWDMSNDGRILNGTNDAFDAGFDLFYMPYSTVLETSMSGRQFTIRGMSTQNNVDIEYERNLYVPATAGWARFVDTATNLGTTTQTISFSVRTDLGSNYGTTIVATSSGDLTYDPTDRYLITDDGIDPGDPFVGMAFGDGTLAPNYTMISYDDVVFNFDVTLAPGESASIVYFGVQGYDQAEVLGTLQTLSGAATEAMLDGIAPELVGKLLNYEASSSLPETYYGNDFDDVIAGLGLDEVFLTYAGDDLVTAGGGADRIEAGDGDDTVQAGTGADLVYAGEGNDVVLGGSGADILHGDDGDDRLIGEDGNDILYGGEGDDVLLAGEGTDTLDGGGGADRLQGDGGTDQLFGGDGDDVLIGGEDGDVLDGGDGLDRASYAGSDRAITIDLSLGTATGGHADGDSLIDIEGLEGTPFDDILIGNSLANQFRPGLGDDSVDGGDGFDVIDYSDAGAAVTVLVGGADALQDTGGGGVDQITSIEGVIGSSFNDTLTGTTAYEEFYGGRGNDTITTNGGGDRAVGGDGKDLLIGGDDAEYFEAGTGKDTVQAGGGNDWIEGIDGLNTIDAGAGNDVVVGGNWIDIVEGGDGEDRLLGLGGADILNGGDGRDTLEGGYSTDTLNGGAGNDLIDGGPQDDILTGGEGQDTFVFSKFHSNDIITDFEVGVDLLYLNRSGLWKRSMVEKHVSEVDGDLVITTPEPDTRTLTLEGVSLAQLDDIDILF